MKRKLLHYSLLTLFMLVVGSGNVWATENDTHDFTQTLQQLLNNNASISSINIAEQTYPVKKVIVSYRYNKELTNAVTVAVSVGGNNWGSQNVVGTDKNYSTLEFTGDAVTGAIAISFTNNTGSGTGHGTFYVNNVQLVEGAVIDPSKEDITLSFPEATYNADIANGESSFSAPTLSNNKSASIDVEYSSSNTAVATVNASTGAVTLIKKGSTTITALFAGDATYNGASASYTLNVVNSNANDGSLAKPFTVTEAIAAIDDEDYDPATNYYVSGIISKIDSYNSTDKAITYWISDDGTTTKQFECYKGKGLNGADFSAVTDLEVGDRVTAVGRLTKYGQVYEFQSGSEISSLTQRTKVNIATFVATATTLLKGATTTTTVTNDTPAWTPTVYTYTSSDEDVATVDADGVITAVAKGTATITVIPNIAGDNATYKAGTSKSVEITVYNPSYNVTFSINGVNESPVSVEEGEDVVFPANPSAIGGKEFVGWTDATIAGSQDAAPATLITTATTTMGGEDITYYAVFANESIEETDINLTISYNTANIPASYGTANTFTEYTFEGKKFKVQQMYKNGDKLQWRASGNSNGTGSMYNTDALNKIQSVVLTYDNSDSYKNFTLSIGNSENPTSGTSITPSSTGNVYTFDCSAENKNYFVLTNGTNAGYLTSIKITYRDEASIYTGYCTSITEPVTISASKYNTYASTNAMNFSGSDVKAYTAKVSGDDVVLTEITGGIVPANTGVIVYSETAGTFNIPVTTTDATVSDNELVGVTTKTAVPWEADGKYNYILQKDGEGVVKFFKATGASLKANRAYLSTTYNVSAAARGLNIVFADDMTTGIREKVTVNSEKFATAPVYNLNGQRVSQPTRGLYIVNGKKVVVK